MKIIPQSDNLVWTRHSLAKISFYNLSQVRVKRVLRYPVRVEEGIVPATIAAMQEAGSKKHPYEIWVMYAIEKSQNNNLKSPRKTIKIISAWKYPGKTKPGSPIPIPQDILEEILKDYS